MKGKKVIKVQTCNRHLHTTLRKNICASCFAALVISPLGSAQKKKPHSKMAGWNVFCGGCGCPDCFPSQSALPE